MKKAGDYKKSDNTDSVQHDDKMCGAYGCPMAGSIKLADSRMWMCRFHYRSDPGDWSGITARLKNRWKLREFINQLERSSTFTDQDKLMEYPEILMEEGENSMRYAGRLKTHLKSTIQPRGTT